jgi:hypothetical protein
MEELFTEYYGLDWVAMIAGLATIYLLGSKKRSGFIVGIIAGIVWTAVNLIAEIWPGIILNVILIGLYIRGYVNWAKSS